MNAPSGSHGVLLRLAYVGTHYSGWARQNNARTIAGELEGAVRAVDPRASDVKGVSRTDAGVHARCQLASFDATKAIEPRGWCLALAQQLPDDVAVTAAAPVPAGYDPRGHVAWKRYRYTLLRRDLRDPFLGDRSWRLFEDLDLDAMGAEAAALVGTHDFDAFRGARDQRTETVRTLMRVDLVPGPLPHTLELVVVGDRFLYNMVRIIAGTIVDVGRRRVRPGAVARALASRDRRDLGMTAPPHGLVLDHIELNDAPADVWPEPLHETVADSPGRRPRLPLGDGTGP